VVPCPSVEFSGRLYLPTTMRDQAPTQPNEALLRFSTQPHRFYAGIDRHARTLPRCVLDQAGTIVTDKHLPGPFDSLLEALAPFRDDLVVGVECRFGWYGLADRCAEHALPFVLGHARSRKLLHGAKAKNDKSDANKIARLLRGGNLPLASV